MIKVIDPTDIEARCMEAEGAHQVTMRVLVGPEQGALRFVMRLFEVAEGGYTPLHQHDWEHQVYFLEGEGEVAAGERRLQVQAGKAVYVPAGEKHQFVNIGASVLRFLCIIPARAQPCCEVTDDR